MLLAHVHAGVGPLLAIRYPTLRMHVHDGQLFGLHGSDKTGRCVDRRKANPRTECSKAYRVWRTNRENHRGAGLWTSGQFELALEPARWPWTTLRVAHRTSLCPLAHSLPPRLPHDIFDGGSRTLIWKIQGLMSKH